MINKEKRTLTLHFQSMLNYFWVKLQVTNIMIEF